MEKTVFEWCIQEQVDFLVQSMEDLGGLRD